MSDERLAQVEDIYHAILEVSADDWPSFLTSTCGEDDELRHEVESLLSFSRKPHSLIDIPPLDVAAEVVRANGRPDIIGKKIKHYKILSQLGTGGMGDVFLAKETMLERNVAIKFVSLQFSHDAAGLKRFLQEAKTLSSLNHPNIITIHAVGKSKDTPFIATEFIDGKTLRRVMDEGELSFRDSLDVALQVASALVAAHSAGVFHRDIKPENIMIREDKLIKVVDFGLAKIAGTPSILIEGALPRTQIDPQLSDPGLVMGTIAYMSPEQAAGKQVDARSDIWSLGVVMFEMFTGKKPFIGTTPSDVIASILNDPPKILNESIPPAIKAMISKTLAKEPACRYQSADELLLDIRELDGFPGVGTDFETDSRAIDDMRRTVSVSAGHIVPNKVTTHTVFASAAAIVLVAFCSMPGYFYPTASSESVNSRAADGVAI